MAARPRTFDRDETLDEALELFRRQGYEATSVQDLVDATGVNRASLYNTFGSKHALYLDALQRYRAQRQSALLRMLTADAAPLETVRALLERVADEAASCPDKGSCLLTNAATERGASDADTATEVRSGFRQLEAALADVLSRGHDDGTVSATSSPAAQARFLLATVQGLRVLARTCPPRDALQDVVDTALRAVAAR